MKKILTERELRKYIYKMVLSEIDNAVDSQTIPQQNNNVQQTSQQNIDYRKGILCFVLNLLYCNNGDYKSIENSLNQNNYGTYKEPLKNFFQMAINDINMSRTEPTIQQDNSCENKLKQMYGNGASYSFTSSPDSLSTIIYLCNYFLGSRGLTNIYSNFSRAISNLQYYANMIQKNTSQNNNKA